MNKQLEKYLRTRAITTPWKIEGTERQNYKAAIVIPALAEGNSLPKTLESLATNPAEYLQQTLILIVVNNRKDVSDDQFQDNQQTLSWLRSTLFTDLNLAWVDAASAGNELPLKEGVGLARKIGFDLALSLLDWSQKPLLISLDADSLVDENYLQAIFTHFNTSQSGGATVPFRHQSAADPQQEAAIRRYELYLRSYLFGLQQAGSPYAYHTIGSTVACRAAAYVAAGGMNRRQAAEDFYFLQQLTKTSGVEPLFGTLVQPSPRFSSRVPFGTGRVVQGEVEQGRTDYRFIPAAGFQVLRDWLSLADRCWQAPAEEVLYKAISVLGVPDAFLRELDFPAVWQKLQLNHRQQKQFVTAFNCWFDALRTRQLLTQVAPSPVGENQLVAELLQWGELDFSEGSDLLRVLEARQGVNIENRENLQTGCRE